MRRASHSALSDAGQASRSFSSQISSSKRPAFLCAEPVSSHSAVTEERLRVPARASARESRLLVCSLSSYPRSSSPPSRSSFNMSKRGASPPPSGALIKRARSGSPAPNTQIAISSSNNEREQGLIRTIKRTSSLEAPIISLSGSHGVCIYFYCYGRALMHSV